MTSPWSKRRVGPFFELQYFSDVDVVRRDGQVFLFSIPALSFLMILVKTVHTESYTGGGLAAAPQSVRTVCIWHVSAPPGGPQVELIKTKDRKDFSKGITKPPMTFLWEFCTQWYVYKEGVQPTKTGFFQGVGNVSKED